MRLYNAGDKVGTRGAIFVREIDNDKPGRYIECQCAMDGCDNTFIAKESSVARDRVALCNKCRNRSKKKNHYANVGEKVADDDKAPILLATFINDNGKEHGVYQCACSTVFARNRYDAEVNKRWRCPDCHSKDKSNWKKKFYPGDFIDKDRNIFWIKETTTETSRGRTGIFLNIKENRQFQSTLKHVLYQECRYGAGASYREQLVASILDDLHVNYVREKSFGDCISPKGRRLRFDFYLPDINMAIEIDGEQHYHPVPRFGGEKGYQYLVQCDSIKDTYCANNNIALIRIKYDAFLHRQIDNDYFINLLQLKGGTKV